MRLDILLGCSLFVLIACNPNGTAAALPTHFTTQPTSKSTASLAGPAATKLPPTRQNATQVPVVTPVAELQATLEADLPATATPDGSGFSEHGFDGVTILPLETDHSDQTLWAAFTNGFVSYDPWQPHHVAIYAHRNEAWFELGRLELNEPFFLDADSVRQVFVEPSRIWLEVNSGVGAHGGCYDLLSFDGETLRSEVSHCHESPGAGRLMDLNHDGVWEVRLDLTTNYVFCYACGVRLINYQLFRWGGNRMSEVTLASLPESSSMEVRDLNNRAVELAKAGLWPEAQITIDRALVLDDAQQTITWNAHLIDLHADARAEQARVSQYPLLDNVFYGDYTAALELMRPYPVAEIFGLHSPLIRGTIAEPWQPELANWILQSTELALEAEPDLAAAFFLRAWATYLTQPDSRHVLDDLEQAATLAPDEPMFSQSLRYLSPTPTVAPTEVHPGQALGVLAGHVTIGPLTPVEIQGRPTPTPAPEVYASRKILIFAADGQTEISQVSIQPDGTYWVELPVGTYVVDINRLGIDRAAGLPQTVQIISQQVTRLDLDIDTGIR